MKRPRDFFRRLDRRERDQGPAPEAETPTDELRRRLKRRLRRSDGDAAGAPDTHPPETITFSRDLPRRAAAPSPTPGIGPPVQLADAAPGREIAAANSAAWVIDRPVTSDPDGGLDLCRGFAETLADPAGGLWSHVAPLALDGAIVPGDFLFIDLETTGLGSTPLFLIGAMLWEGDGFVVRQLFARDYSEERAVLALFAEMLAERRALVSFNGKSFDVPFLRARAAANAVAVTIDLPHLDLLHAGRRAWKHRLPDCRLQTLERHVCGRLRHEDIPGAFIPDAYHAYVRTGNAAQMTTVLEHNVRDLVTLAEIMLHLPEPSAQ